MLKSFCNFNL